MSLRRLQQQQQQICTYLLLLLLLLLRQVAPVSQHQLAAEAEAVAGANLLHPCALYHLLLSHQQALQQQHQGVAAVPAGRAAAAVQ
jgi:hypothetical protein